MSEVRRYLTRQLVPVEPVELNCLPSEAYLKADEVVLASDYDALQQRCAQAEALAVEALAIANEPDGVNLRVRETRIVNWKREATALLTARRGRP